MIGKLVQASVLVTAGLAISGFSGCTPKTVATKPPPAPDYMAPSPPSPPSAATRATCYNEGDLSTLRVRMLQQEMSVVTLQCQTPSGSRAFDSQYGSFLQKYSGDLSANARALNDLSRKRRFNVDVVVTEFANRTAQKAPVDPQFCARGLRALEWALDPKATSLAMVPPPYDLGPDMNFHPCAAK
ncbi:MAG TPA: hypothetical protein VKY24_14305 [Reyranella sp.]|jgi:hypothetical protein|nr:hypothetical protein [Reyranella sp.]